MAEQVQEAYELIYLGRGLHGEPWDGDAVEASVNLEDLGSELETALERFETRPHRAWLPLTTVVAGVPDLVWEADDNLIPTHVPVPPLVDEDRWSEEPEEP